MGVSGHFGTENYTQRFDIVQNFCQSYQFVLPDFCAHTSTLYTTEYKYLIKIPILKSITSYTFAACF